MSEDSRDSGIAAQPTGYQWGYRCHLCQWTERSISHNLMDTDMLIDHGMRQHYITHSPHLAQFVQNAIFEERIPRNCSFGSPGSYKYSLPLVGMALYDPAEDRQEEVPFGKPSMNIFDKGMGGAPTLGKSDSEDRKGARTRQSSHKPGVAGARLEDLFTTGQLAHEESIVSSLEANAELLVGVSMEKFDFELKAVNFSHPRSRCLIDIQHCTLPMQKWEYGDMFEVPSSPREEDRGEAGELLDLYEEIILE